MEEIMKRANELSNTHRSVFVSFDFNSQGQQVITLFVQNSRGMLEVVDEKIIVKVQ